MLKTDEMGLPPPKIMLGETQRALWNPPPKFIVLFSVLMVKWHFINQKACLINWVLQLYIYQILFSIIFWIPYLMVPQYFNNQKHHQFIDFFFFVFFSRNIAHLNFSPK